MKNIIKTLKHTPWIANALKNSIYHIIAGVFIALFLKKSGLHNPTLIELLPATLGGIVYYVSDSYLKKDMLLKEAALLSSPSQLQETADLYGVENGLELKIKYDAVLYSGPVIGRNGEQLSFVMNTPSEKKAWDMP